MIASMLLTLGLPVLFITVMHFKAKHGKVFKPMFGKLFWRKPILRETMDPKSLFTLINFRVTCTSTSELNRAARRLLNHLRDKSWFVNEDLRIFEHLYRQEYDRVHQLEREREARERARAKETKNARDKHKAPPKTQPMKGWRAILAISANERDATVIKQTYRKLAMKHHPDRGGSVTKMAEINRAYETARQELSF